MRLVLKYFVVFSTLALFGTAYAADDKKPVEEVITTGTQIKGATIAESLPVSVVTFEDIEALGFDSGDEILDYIAENGSNFVNEAENISGGVNSARGDVGAFNLRNLGTGNTLVLLNGRRMINSATYQTEEIGGSFVPVNSANSNEIPVYGVEQIEVLRDGASAIYGADAVAGVVNTVLKKDFEGLSVRAKYNWFDNTPRNDQTVGIEWGKNFNGGKTNIGTFFSYYHRDRVNSQDDPRWADADFRYRIPEGSPWEGSTSFRNDSANSGYGQYDVTGASASGTGLSGVFTDSSGEFETYPAGDPRCQWDLGYGTCGGIDGQGTYRHNLNENRDLSSELDRTSLFVFLNSDFDNGIESFTELGLWVTETNMFRHASAPFSTVKLRVGNENYYNPFGPCGSPNRLDASLIPDVPCEGLTLEIDNYRFDQVPRIVDNDGTTWRFLQGFRGALQKWDWESAVLWSKATKEDITHNRVSNTLIQEALEDPTPAAFNPFSGRLNSNIERGLIDVYRNNDMEMKLIDVKLSRNDVFNLPAGPVGLLFGAEYRSEKFKDDRDPRLDGTIVFTDFQGDTYPLVSDVVNSSPTPDSSGSRNVTSLFTEFQIPVLDSLDVQLALRFEDFSDVGSTTVGKFATGWRPIDELLVRASWSQAFRAPNLITINEQIVARQNTRTDYTCLFADPDEGTLDCVNSTQRVAQGSKALKAEESTNYSYGIVLDPFDFLTITLDQWSIEKDDTIGLFGEENHTILDLLNRINHGTADCSTLVPNPAVVREDPDPDEEAVYLAAGICPAGLIQYIDDNYLNLDKRTLKGTDLGIYLETDSAAGSIDVRYLASFLQKYEQAAGGDSLILVDAQAAGIIPPNIPVTGFADLVRQDGNPKSKQTVRVSWRKGDWGASLTGLRVGDFVQTSLTLSDGTEYVVPAMTTFNGTIDYRFDIGPRDARARFGIINIADERAPLADRYFGYYADVHRDLGRYFYLDFKLDFDRQ